MQYALVRAQRTSSLNTDDSWMYEDGHDEIVFSVDQPCQLLGVGLCGTEGAYTAELELLEVHHLLLDCGSCFGSEPGVPPMQYSFCMQRQCKCSLCTSCIRTCCECVLQGESLCMI